MNNIEIVKKDLISQIDKRLEDKIIEPTNAELLKKLIRNAETINDAIMIAELGTTYKRTGFHFDKRLEKMGTDIKYLKRNEDLSFVNDADRLTHKLIIGDNYDALQNLLITHRGMIDVIYIDPPYGKDSMGEFAKTNYENAISRDNLLSMLYPRLVLARQLLSDDGIIFCSIDDRNSAYVRGLFDEVFNDTNYIEEYIWESNFKPDNSSKILRKNAEYVLCYAKNKANIKYFQGTKSNTSGEASLTKSKEKVKTLTFPAGKVYTTLPDGTYEKGVKDNGSNINWELIEDVVVKDGVITSELIVKGPSYWATSLKIEKELESGNEIWIKSEAFIPYVRKNSISIVRPTKILPRDTVRDYQLANNMLKDVLGELLFTNSKPIQLISFLTNFLDNKNLIILDFFAGSGTTGQAVMELNREDGGNRQFILCTNNEVTDKTPKGIAYDVTSKRLKRIMSGKCYDGTKDFKWIEKNEPYGDSLDVYEVEVVNSREQSLDKSPFEVIDETNYGLEPFKTIQEKVAWICNNFENTQKYIDGEE